MAKADQKKAWISLAIILSLVIIIVIINVWLAWIQFSRFLFWLDIILIPLSLITIIISVIAYYQDEWNQDEWLITGAISFFVLLLTFSTVSGAYNKGYSNEAIQTKAELEKMLEDYTFILSIYTGEFRLKIQGMVMDEFTKALCEAAPETPCDQVITSYNTYQELIGWKESADSISKIWRK